VNIFTLARRIGTSVQMIDRTYGHLAANADDYERELLDAFTGRVPDDLSKLVGAVWGLGLRFSRATDR
jgi:hypothetical protein